MRTVECTSNDSGMRNRECWVRTLFVCTSVAGRLHESAWLQCKCFPVYFIFTVSLKDIKERLGHLIPTAVSAPRGQRMKK